MLHEKALIFIPNPLLHLYFITTSFLLNNQITAHEKNIKPIIMFPFFKDEESYCSIQIHYDQNFKTRSGAWTLSIGLPSKRSYARISMSVLARHRVRVLDALLRTPLGLCRLSQMNGKLWLRVKWVATLVLIVVLVVVSPRPNWNTKLP